jgi:hypothetical protein
LYHVKSSQKVCSISATFTKTALSKQLPNGRKSGHPGWMKYQSHKERKVVKDEDEEGERKLSA